MAGFACDDVGHCTVEEGVDGVKVVIVIYIVITSLMMIIFYILISLLQLI
jgi:hypothetical protein